MNTLARIAASARRAPILTALLLAACGGNPPKESAAVVGALRIALAPHEGTTAVDEQIREVQARVKERVDVPRLERLATLYIGKARGSGDPGYYRLAEASADAMPQDGGGQHAAMLVRGHVRHALHDFAAAETIARRLVAERGMFLDHGLLGDVLLDLGRLEEARDVYQRMLDLKPCLQSYARAAHVRWLVGDIAGSRELLHMAASAGSHRDPESMAWVLARRATLELQANDAETALTYADAALERVVDHPQALLARGRALLALGDATQAEASLGKAVACYPLPEYLWAHADALRAGGREGDAARVEADLLRTGEREDPRTFAAWLATTGQHPETALRLAEAEFRIRQDALTADVLAAARVRMGDYSGAATAMQQALAVGPADARVRLHAAMVDIARGESGVAGSHLAAADAARAALLPSERALLADLRRRL
ncbi:MAG: tetratricopeptide repeat protein [Planctomycetes bacterium]|nr:tetratricopeptide repeat protein [Planctomycetota bacterium]